MARIDELITLIPTQFKKTDPENELREGHSVRKLGEWTMEDGFVKTQSLSRELNAYTEALPCPVVAIVTEKFGKHNIEFTITGKKAQPYTIDGEQQTIEKNQGEYTLEYDKYEATDNTEDATLHIPRFTKPNAVFSLTGLGTTIYEIESVTYDFPYSYNTTGKLEFYALSSEGTKVLYWFSIHKITQMLKSMLLPWIQPSQCQRCDGTGIEPNTTETLCEQCNGYKYSGFNSIKYVQQLQGFDVGLRREDIPNWEQMSDSEYETVRKFINKCWTQRWWVTPTKGEIKRLFAHFYDIGESEVFITERFHYQEPIWYISLPESGSLYSPFQTTTDSDSELMKYIARSVTPAGVSVFVGFYTFNEFGNFEDFTDKLHFEPLQFKSSIEHSYALNGQPRWDFWNGWCECTENFEVSEFSETDFVPDSDGNSELVNANDQGRHWIKMSNNSMIEITGSTIGSVSQSGYAELWMHPGDGKHRFGMFNGGSWMWYVYFENSGFYDNNDNLLRYASKHNDYNISVYFNATVDTYDVKINRIVEGTGIAFDTPNTIDDSSTFVIQTDSGYADDKCYIDNFGCSFETGYEEGDNWQRLYPAGWGLTNEREDLSGYDIHDRIIRRNRPIFE